MGSEAACMSLLGYSDGTGQRARGTLPQADTGAISVCSQIASAFLDCAHSVSLSRNGGKLRRQTMFGTPRDLRSRQLIDAFGYRAGGDEAAVRRKFVDNRADLDGF